MRYTQVKALGGVRVTDTCGALYCRPVFHEFCIGCCARVGVGETSPCRGFRPSGEADILKTRLRGEGDSSVGKVFACKHERRPEFNSQNPHIKKQGMVVHIYDSSTGEADTGGSPA